MRFRALRSGLAAVLMVLAFGCGDRVPPDEALQRVREEGGEYADLGPRSDPIDWQRAAEAYYPPAYRDYFEAMDAIGSTDDAGPRPLELGEQEVKGRNAWVIWTAGNEAWWDWLARYGYGTIDLLKLIDDRGRESRFARSGLVNEPGTRPPTPEETEQAFGVRYARPVMEPTPGLEVHVEYRDDRDNWEPPDPRIYGYPTGVVGLRLFLNPDFDAAAQQQWDADLYYADTPEGRRYSARPDTIRPFRVGMSCGYCHIAPHPLKPPADPEFPKWENLSNNIGNQFMRMRVAFGNSLRPDNYFYHVFDSYMPGAVDTSGHPSDNNNNPNTVNAVFGLRGRLDRAQHNPMETLGRDSLSYVASHTDEGGENPRHLARVLLDGSDSVGVHIALARVYLNIGTHHQQWIRTINPLLGFHDQRPFKLGDIAGHSLYWHATRIRVNPMAAFFLASTDPMRLKDIEIVGPDGARQGQRERDLLRKHLRGTGLPWYSKASGGGEAPREDDGPPVVGDPEADYEIGRQVFARGCIACHSSVQPGDVLSLEEKLVPREGLKYLPPLGPRPPSGKIWTRAAWEAQMDITLAGRRRLRLTLEDRARLARGDGRLPASYAEWASEAVKHREFWEYPSLAWDLNGNPVLAEDGQQQRLVVHNFLSIDDRLPVTIPRTNSARAMATNSVHGHVWEDFASLTYQELGEVGPVSYRDPVSGATKSYSPPGGGPGYYRVPSLISVWSTAPLLHNNALGLFNNDPSVEGRLAAFDDAINRLLWPDKRRVPSRQVYWPGAGSSKTVHDAWYRDKNADEAVDDPAPPTQPGLALAADQRERDGGWIWRTTEESWLMFNAPHVPMLVGGVVGLSRYQMQLVAWLPALVFLVLGIALLLSGRLVRFRERIGRRLSWLEWFFGPFRWVIAAGSFLLAVASIYLIWRFWPAVELIDLGTGGAISGLRIQAILFPVVLFVSTGLIFSVHLIRSERARTLITRWLGVLCLVLSVVAVLGVGRTLAGVGENIQIGPVPEGVPVNIVANFDPHAPKEARLDASKALVHFFSRHQEQALADRSFEAKDRRRREFEMRVAPILLRASRSPDFVTDRGHDYVFIRDFTDEEKCELIALLKTF
jgi:mono/diheme cytochrome c family protein